jgi:glycosyltransferase involved in cell wall biosynthesis
LYAIWLQHDINHLNLAGVVHLYGGCDDVDGLIVGADLFLLPSREDPYPLVNVAALGCGVPVIAFDGAGGAPEAIGTDGGAVVPYLDVSAMADATLRLMSDDVERERLGRCGRQRFEEELTIGTFADRLLSVLPVAAPVCQE